MTNEQIKELFEQAYEMYRQDMIGLLYYLSLHKAEYEASDFFKQTKLTIFETYSLYHSTALTYKNLLNNIQDALNNVDLTIFNDNMSLDTLFEQIPAEYTTLLQEIIKEVK